MASASDDGVFWLPQFLTDGDLLVDDMNEITKPRGNKYGVGLGTEGSKLSFPFQSSRGFGSLDLSSDLSSPVESESDEEDFLSGLTLQMARATLEDELRRGIGRPLCCGKAKASLQGWGLSGSPQSTFCPAGRGCGCRLGSPNCHSQVTSPPGTWNLLHAAAEEARMRIAEEACRFSHSRGLFPAPAKPDPNQNTNLDVGGFYPTKKLHGSEMLEQQSAWGAQKQREALRSRGRKGHSEFVSRRSNGAGRPLNLSPSAWPHIQQGQNGSGMRAVFLGSNAAGKKECAGTGVFLPRRIGAPAETRKKSACSTVLLPARVVQALNLNLDESGGQQQFQPRLNGSFTSVGDATARLRSGNVLTDRQALRPQQAMNHGVRLPQDWTY